MENSSQLSNLEIEKNILGTVLTSSENVEKLCSSIENGSFSEKKHNVIYDAIKELYKEGKEVNAATVTEKLESKGALDEVGGKEYLDELVNCSETSADMNSSNSSVSNTQTASPSSYADYDSGGGMIVYNPVSAGKAAECLLAMRELEDTSKFGQLKMDYDETNRYSVEDGSKSIDSVYYSDKATKILIEAIKCYDAELDAFDSDLKGKLIGYMDNVRDLTNDSDDIYIIQDYDYDYKLMKEHGMISIDEDMDGITTVEDKIAALEELSKKVESGEISDLNEYMDIRQNIEANFSRITNEEALDLINSRDRGSFVKDIANATGMEVRELESMNNLELAEAISAASLGSLAALAEDGGYASYSGSSVNTALYRIQDDFFCTDEGRQALWEQFKKNSETVYDQENAIANTEYIKYCISKGKENDWLVGELQGIASTVKMINLNGHFSYTQKIEDAEYISQIEEYKKTGGSLPYNISCINGEYYEKVYTLAGEDVLYYMDYHFNENNIDEPKIITAFSKQAELDAYERNYKENYIQSHAIGDISRESAERDYYILNGVVEDDKRFAELKKAGEKSFEEMIAEVNNMYDSSVEDVNNMYNFSVEGVSEEDIEKYGKVQAQAYHNQKVLMSTLGVTTFEGLVGLAKSVENIGDAINMAVHSDIWLSGVNKEYFGIKKDYNELQEKYWNEFVENGKLYDAQLKEYLKNPNTLKNAVESFKRTYYDPNTGNYFFKGKTYSSYEDIPLDIQQEQLNTFMVNSFKNYKMDEWSLESSSSSNIYLAAFKEGIRNGGKFDTFNELDDVIVEHANEQFNAMEKVAIDYVGTFAEEERAKDWYKELEAYSFAKHDNILGLTANQIGNMALPVLSSTIPVFGQTISSGLLFASAFGGAAEESIKSGGNYNETLQYATLSAATELLIEKAFSGIAGFGEGWMDNVLEFVPNKIIKATNLTDSLAAQIAKKMLTNGMGEGIEEIVTDFVTPLWQSLTYMNEKSYSEIRKENVTLESEVETFLVSFLTSMVFGTSNISRQYKHFNNQMNNLQSEIGNIPGMKDSAMKVFAEILGNESSMSSPEIINRIIEKTGKELTAQISNNPQSLAAINDLQQKLIEAQTKINNTELTITVNDKQIKLPNNLALTIADTVNLNGNFEINGENLTFASEKEQKKFIEALYKMQKDQLSSISSVYTNEINKHNSAKLLAKLRFSKTNLEDAIKSITDHLDGIIDTTNIVKVKIDENEFDVPYEVMETISKNAKNPIDLTQDIVVVDKSQIKEVTTGIYEQATSVLETVRDAYSSEIVKLNQDIKNNDYTNIESVIKETSKNVVDNESTVVVSNAEKVDGKDLNKLEVTYTENGETRKVNVYVENSTNSKVYTRDEFTEKLQEVIKENSDSKNIYMGELTYNRKSNSINSTLTDAGKAFVELQNENLKIKQQNIDNEFAAQKTEIDAKHNEKISVLTEEQQIEKEQLIEQRNSKLNALESERKSQVPQMMRGVVSPHTVVAEDNRSRSSKEATPIIGAAAIAGTTTGVMTSLASEETIIDVSEKDARQKETSTMEEELSEEDLEKVVGGIPYEAAVELAKENSKETLTMEKEQLIEQRNSKLNALESERKSQVPQMMRGVVSPHTVVAEDNRSRSSKEATPIIGAAAIAGTTTGVMTSLASEETIIDVSEKDASQKETSTMEKELFEEDLEKVVGGIPYDAAVELAKENSKETSTMEEELSEEDLEKVVGGIPYEAAREIEREKNRNLSEKAMGGLFYTTKELSQKLKSGSIVNLSEKEIRSIANEIIKGKIHLDNYSIDLKSAQALIEKGVSGDAISRLKNYTQIKLARVYEILIEKYGKEEAYIRLKEYANTGNSLKITRAENARTILESVERSKVINFVNRLASPLNNSVNAKNISPRKKQINDIERFVSLYGKSNGEIYSPYVTFDTPKFNTLPTRAFLENRYRGLQNVETFYWTNQGGITNRNLTNETGAFFNISIGREPTNVPYGNSYKIYLPVTSESFQYTATRVFDYMIKNNIASENKIANTARSDAIVLRIYDINDAIDVLNLISSDPNIPSNSQGIPFVMRTGKASIAMDGNLSYNSVSTDMFQAYSRTTINPTIDGFKIYLDSILKQVYNDGNLNDVKSIFGFNLDAAGYVNHLQVIKLLRLSIDENVTINTYLQNCLNNQNSDKVFSDIRFIQGIMNSSSNTWQHQYHAQSSLTTIDINEYQNPNASLVINYENTQKVELPNYLVEEFGTSAIERFRNTINNKEKLIDMFNQADKRMISLTNKFFEYLYNEYEVINEDSRVDLYDEKLRSLELLAKTMEKGYKVLNVEEVINNNSLPISLSFDLLSKYSERTFEILNNILSLEKNKLGNYVKTLNKPEIQEVLKLLNEKKFSSGSNENIFEFVSKTAEDKKMSIIDKISKNIFKQNRSITLSKEYHQFETIYKNTKKIDIAIESLEKAGYKTTNIADVILSYGYNGNSIDITRAFYYKAFDYLVEKGIEEKRAAEIISNNARKIVSQKGTRIIATTKSGINIRIINGANLANVVISPEQIQEIIEEAERMYANTNLNDIIIQDTFDPDNIYSEKVQYEDYVKNNINKRFIAEASANSTSIEIFADLDEIYTLFHEYAHCIDFSLLKDKDLSNTSEWINAIKLDKEITFDPITAYATASNAEDFAEFISEFKKKPIEIGMKYPNRYMVASKYLNLEIDEKVLEKYDSIEIIEYLERVTSSSFVDVLNSYINDTLENKSIAKFLDKRYTNKVELIREVGLHDLVIKIMLELKKNKQEILPIIKDYMDGKENALPKQHTNLLNQFSFEEIKEYYDEEKNSSTGEPILDIPLEVLSESFIDVSENVPNESDFADTYSNVQNKEFDVEAFHESYQKLNEDEKVLKLESLTDEQLAAYFEKHLTWSMFDVFKNSKDDNFKIRAYKNTNSNYLYRSAEMLSTISDENIKLELIESEKENIEVGLLVATLSDDEFKVNYLKNCNSKNHDVIHEIIKSLKDETLIDKIFNETGNIVVKEYIISTKNNDELKMKFLDEFGNGLSSDGILLILISFKNANEKIKYVKKYKDALPPYNSIIGYLIKSINNVDLKMECLKLFKVKDNFFYRISVMRTLESISEQEFKSEYLIDYKDIMESDEIIRVIKSRSSDKLKLECLKGCADVLESYQIYEVIESLSSEDSKIAYTIEYADKLKEHWIKSIIASLSDDELKIELLNKTRSNFEYGISSVVSNLDLDENKLVFLEDSTNGFSDSEKVTIINSIKSKSLRKDCLSNKNIILDEDYIGDVIATLNEKDKLEFLDNDVLSDKSKFTVIKSLNEEQRKKYIKTIHSSEYRAEVITLFESDNEKLVYLNDDTFILAIEDKANIISSIKDDEIKIDFLNNNKDILDGHSKLKIIKSLADSLKGQYVIGDAWNFTSYGKSLIISSIKSNCKMKIELLKKTKLDISDFIEIVRYGSLFTNENIVIPIKEQIVKDPEFSYLQRISTALTESQDVEKLRLINLMTFDSNTIIELFDKGELKVIKAIYEYYNNGVELVKNTLNDNLKALKIIEVYNSLNENTAEVFKKYLFEEFNGVTRHDKFEITNIEEVAKLITRISTSNAIELRNSQSGFADMLLKQPKPLESLEKVEEIFLRNNLPYVGKVMKVFQTLYSRNLDVINSNLVNMQRDLSRAVNIFKYNVISPYLKSKWEIGDNVKVISEMERVIFRDLIRISLRSNNKSMKDYIENIKVGNKIFESIETKEDFDNLTSQEKETLEIFASHLDMLYNSLKGRTLSKENLSLYENIGRMKRVFTRNYKYNLPDSIISIFCHEAGFDTIEEVENYMNEELVKTDTRNREYAYKLLSTNEGVIIDQYDVLKGIGNVKYLESMLQNGIVPGELIAEEPSYDTTPLGIDWWMKTFEGKESLYAALKRSGAIDHSYPIHIVMANEDHSFTITRTNEVKKSEHTQNFIETKIDEETFDLNKPEFYYCGSDQKNKGYDHYDSRTGVSFADIRCIVTDQSIARNNQELYDFTQTIAFEIAKNGYYIPIVDRVTGKVIFTPEEFDMLREKMTGMSYYGMNEYNYSETLKSTSDIVTNELFEYLKTTNSSFVKNDIIQEIIGNKSIGIVGKITTDVIEEFKLIENGNIDKLSSEKIVELYDKFKNGEFDSIIRTKINSGESLSTLLRLSELDVVRKRNAVNNTISEVLKEFDLSLKTQIDGDITAGYVEVIDTGSTGRKSNVPGDGDFDFTVRIDADKFNNPEFMSKLSNALRTKFESLESTKTENDPAISKGAIGNDIRYENVKLDGLDVLVDIDISFIQKTNKVEYSTDMSLSDRYSQMDSNTQNLVIANVIRIKQLMKEYGCYKPSRKDENQSGLGGVGYENLILQSGGSLLDAAMSFIEGTRTITYKEYLKINKNATFIEYLDRTKENIKTFSEFYQTYSLWDFGKNHFAEKKDAYPHDNFVDNMTSDRKTSNGYSKIIEAFESYIKSVDSHTEKNKKIIIGDFEIFDVSNETKNNIGKSDNVEMIDESVISTTELPKQRKASNKTELDAKETNTGDVSNNFNDIMRDKKLTIDEKIKKVLTIALSSNNLDIANAYKNNLYMKLAKGQEKEITTKIEKTCESILKERGYEKILEVNIGGTENIVIEAVKDFKGDLNGLVDFINKHIPKMIAMYENPLKLEKIVINDTFSPKDCYFKWKTNNSNFEAEATVDYKEGIINLWGSFAESKDPSTLYHEYAHLVQRELSRKHNDFEKEWVNAVKEDDAYITEYAKQDLTEDFAETFGIFHDGNQLEVASKFIHRYYVLSKYNLEIMLSEKEILSVIYDALNRKKIDFSSTLNEFFKTGTTSKYPVIANILKEYKDSNGYQNLKEHLNLDNGVYSLKENIKINDSIIPKKGMLKKEKSKFNNSATSASIFNSFKKSSNDLFDEVLNTGNITNLNETELIDLIYEIKMKKINLKNYELNSESVRLLIDKGIKISSIYPLFYIGPVNAFIRHFGIDVISRFEELNNGFLLGNGGQTLDDIFNSINGEFPNMDQADKYDELEKLIEKAINSKFEFDYQALEGSEFATKYPELFLDENVPQDIKDLYYNKKIDDGNRYEEKYFKYLEGKSIGGVVTIKQIPLSETNYLDYVNEHTDAKSYNHRKTLSLLSNRLRIPPAEIQLILDTKVQELIDDSTFAVRRTINSLDKILDDGKFKNQFEIKSSSHGIKDFTLRMEKEFVQIGVPSNLRYEDRPIYGMLLPNITGDDIHSNYKYLTSGPGAYYSQDDGVIYVFDKEKIINNTTISLGDTITYGVGSTNMKSPKFFGRFDDILRNIKTKEDLEAIDLRDAYTNFFDILDRNKYYEFQIHGEECHRLDNIKEILFMKEPSSEIKGKLNKMNIPFRIITKK